MAHPARDLVPRGEHAPFVGVYEPWKVLFYHYGGEVVPAALQTYSFGILHASHTLSLVHDVAFFLFGCCVSFIVTSAGARRLWQSLLVGLAMLFSGPLVKFWDGSTRPAGGGYSLPDFLNTSYRPHVSLAALFMLPFVALPLGRLRDDARELGAAEALFPLAACAMALLITDEFSLGLLGLSLGVMWLVRPQILGADRKAGLLVLAGLAAAVGFAFFVLKGTIAPGAPHYALKFMPPSSPGFYSPPLPLTTERGRTTFLLDLIGVLGVLVGGVIIAAGRRDRATLVSLLGYAVLSLAGTWMFATFTYNGDGLQNHRFQTAPMLLGPLFAALWLFWSVERRALVAKLLGGLVLVATLGAGFFLDGALDRHGHGCRGRQTRARLPGARALLLHGLPRRRRRADHLHADEDGLHRSGRPLPLRRMPARLLVGAAAEHGRPRSEGRRRPVRHGRVRRGVDDAALPRRDR